MLCRSRTFHFQVEFALISLGFSISPRKKPGQMLSALFGFRRKWGSESCHRPKGQLWNWDCVCVHARMRSRWFAQLCLTLCDPWTVAHQGSLSMEFSRQEYWNRLPFPTPRDLPDPGIEPSSFVSLHWNWGKDLSTQGPRCRLPPTSLLPCLQGTCAMYQALCKHQDFPEFPGKLVH